MAIVREVGPDYVSIIEQNYSNSERDAARSLRMTVQDGRYQIAGWQGWMRVPGAQPGCADPKPVLIEPTTTDVLVASDPVTFRWALGASARPHTLRVRNLDTSRVSEYEVGTATSWSLDDLGAGSYRWTIFYRSPSCVDPDSDGRCVADARTFEVASSPQTCGQNACRRLSRNSGSLCDGDFLVACGTQSGCEVELSRSVCNAPQRCSESRQDASCQRTCVERTSIRCDGAAIYEYDSCNNRGSLVRRCASNQTCSGEQCVDNAPLPGFTTSPGTGSTTTRGPCDPANSRAIYRARVMSTTQSDGEIQLRFEKCDGSAASADITYWVVVGSDDIVRENRLCTHSSCTRRSGVWRQGRTSLTVNVDGWPSKADYEAAPSGSTKKLYIITGGGGSPNTRTWFQYQSVALAKTTG